MTDENTADADWFPWETLNELRKRAEEFDQLIHDALGEGHDCFPERQKGDGPYWWRKWLRARYNEIVYPPNAAAPQTTAQRAKNLIQGALALLEVSTNPEDVMVACAFLKKALTEWP